ncbi:hypothetical protein SAMN06269173_10727 [Hymenobacter mucosus]|uniref:Histidine phosphatase superfamily (Branch 1) n=2 Tax=Hymenobacter mucosus TaxID=1411120 RepID=A0A238Z9E0_9BACT|nr:hypothetical protein SAMN06269173_10727 [Hymenobacter mucosus]
MIFFVSQGAFSAAWPSLLRSLVLVVLLLLNHTAMPRTRTGGAVTTVLLVCAAEKLTTTGLPDPPLAPAGQARAQALLELLRRRGVAGLLATSATSSRATVAPLAQTLHHTIQEYNPSQLPAVALRIERQFKGKTVVIVTDPTSVFSLLDALGAPRPVLHLTGPEHDLLLEVRLPTDGFPMVLTRRYGPASETQAAP